MCIWSYIEMLRPLRDKFSSTETTSSTCSCDGVLGFAILSKVLFFA